MGEPRSSERQAVGAHRRCRGGAPAAYSGVWCDVSVTPSAPATFPTLGTVSRDRTVGSGARAPPAAPAGRSPPAARAGDRSAARRSAERQHASGPAPETTAATPVARAARSTSADAVRHRRRAVAWCSRSSVAASSSVGSAGQRCDEQRGPAGVERGVGVRHGRGQQPAGRLGGRARSPGTRTTGAHAGSTGPAGPRAAAGPSVQASVSPPSRQAATLSGWPSISVASASSAASSSRSSPPTASARAATSPATIAAADEPSPRPCGMRLAQRQRAGRGGCPPSASKAGAQRADDEVRLVAGHARRRPRRRPRPSTAASAGDRRADDLVVQVERQAEGVEARARGWRWSPGPRTAHRPAQARLAGRAAPRPRPERRPATASRRRTTGSARRRWPTRGP